jgi:hypothetical protein
MSNREAGGCPYAVPHHGGLPRPLGLCSLRGIVCTSEEGACSQSAEERQTTPRPFENPPGCAAFNFFFDMQANQTSRGFTFLLFQCPFSSPPMAPHQSVLTCVLTGKTELPLGGGSGRS